MTGETVTVVIPSKTSGTDGMGEPMAGPPVSVPCDNVLFDPEPSMTTDLPADTRADNTSSTVCFHFPRSWVRSLKGCRVEYGGTTFEVVGNPRPYADAGTPTPWDRPVYARAVE